MKAVIYARFSTEMQREESIEDQTEICRRYIQSRSWSLVGVYSDAAISGASRQRPEFLRMIGDAERLQFDVVVCEAVDRLGRRLADTSDLYDRLTFRGIKLHTTDIGEITPIHIGVMGMLAQLALKDLGEKTKRGQLGRVLKGKVAGGLAYGYVVREGSEHGDRFIVEHEADVIRRIFREFADGKSPESIAKDLNREAIAGPGGRAWSNTTIRGQAARGTGLLNNNMYRGVLVWNRCSYVKDPHRGKKVARPNAPNKHEVVEVPHLRIVDDALWARVKARQEAIRHRLIAPSRAPATPGNRLNATHRPRFLLSGLVRCGCCAGTYTIVAKDRYGCATRREKGSCDNGRTIARGQIEARVLEGLKERLLAPDLVKVFVQEFNTEVARYQASVKARHAAHERRLAQIDRKISSMINAVEDGMYHPAMKARLDQLQTERVALVAEAEPVSSSNVDVLVHPNLPELYRRKVGELQVMLDDSLEREEARDLIRSMIDKVVLTPNKVTDGIDATLHGELASILAVCAAATGRSAPQDGTSQLSVVAGVGFASATNLLTLWFIEI